VRKERMMSESKMRAEVLLPSLATFQEDMARALAEARPEMLLSLYKGRTLGKHLEEVESRFMSLALDFKKGGRTDREAEEMALRQVMPNLDPEFDPDLITNPIEDGMLAEILRSLNPN
jgi:hypothetical protein